MLFLPLFCLIIAAVLLVILTVIDLRHYLLPNVYVFPFGLLGAIFHASLGFTLIPPVDLLLGAALGGGILLVIRFFGNRVYGQESMGLGDVKLMAAAGLWLGSMGVTLALTFGAMAGLVHGLIVALYRTISLGQKFSMRRLIIPAGPGFIAGIVGVALYTYSLQIFYILFAIFPSGFRL